MPRLGNKPFRVSATRSRPSRASTVGLVLGALVIGAGTWASASNTPESAAASAVLGLAFVAPIVARWPVTRRRCVWIAASWLVFGSLIAVPLWWETGTVVPLAATLAAVPALIGAGVGWGAPTPEQLFDESGNPAPASLMRLRTQVDAEGRLIGHEYVDDDDNAFPRD